MLGLLACFWLWLLIRDKMILPRTTSSSWPVWSVCHSIFLLKMKWSSVKAVGVSVVLDDPVWWIYISCFFFSVFSLFPSSFSLWYLFFSLLSFKQFFISPGHHIMIFSHLNWQSITLGSITRVVIEAAIVNDPCAWGKHGLDYIYCPGLCLIRISKWRIN